MKTGMVAAPVSSGHKKARLQPGFRESENVMTDILSKTLPFGEPQMRVVDVTPEIARQWLDRNLGNRPIAVATVNAYVDEMKKGRWKMTGDAIRFSSSGKLIDGQHRLSAVLKSGIGIRSVVMTGLEDSIFNVIDTGRGRGKSDVLSIEYSLPASITKLLSTAAIIAYCYDHGFYSFKSKISNEDLAEYVRAHPALIRAAQYVHENVPHESPAPKSVAASFFFFAAALDEPRARIFLERFMVGAVLGASDNLLHLRNACFNARAARRPMQVPEIFGRLVKIWNSERRGKPIKYFGNVAIRADESFPQFL